jgi:ribosomal protein S15P/S13E
MFPTLFPLRLAGFEIKRDVAISYQKQAEYFLDLADHSFRSHKYYVFVACNILQRRQSHLHTHLGVKRKDFQSTSQKLAALPHTLVASVATHLQKERPMKDLSDEQREVVDVLNKNRCILKTDSRLPPIST